MDWHLPPAVSARRRFLAMPVYVLAFLAILTMLALWWTAEQIAGEPWL